jgi:hypothetical protein
MNTVQQTPPRYFLKIVLMVLAFLLVPITLTLVVFPLLSESSLTRISDVSADDVVWMNIRMLNREELDGGTDIWPFKVAPEDYEPILEVLREVPEVQEFQGTRGPWLGEIRLRTRSGNDSTIRMYWLRTASAQRAVPAMEALMGEAAARYATMMLHAPVPTLRFQINNHLFEGQGVARLIQVTTEAESRGTPSPR